MRLAILICEDHGRPTQEIASLTPYGPTLVIVPIFSEPIRRHYWEDKNATEEVLAMGTGVVVANSCAVPVPDDTRQMKPCDYGTALAAWPDEETGASPLKLVLREFRGDPERLEVFELPILP